MDMSYHLDDVRFLDHFFPIARRSAAVGLNLTLRLCFTGLTTPVAKLKPPAQVQLIGSSSTMLPIRTGVLFSIAHKTNSVWARMISLTTFLLWPVMAESLSISSVSIIVAVFLLISILIRWCAHGRGRTCISGLYENWNYGIHNKEWMLYHWATCACLEAVGATQLGLLSRHQDNFLLVVIVITSRLRTYRASHHFSRYIVSRSQRSLSK